MHQSLPAVVVASLLASFLAGCSGGGDPDADAPVASASAPPATSPAAVVDAAADDPSGDAPPETAPDGESVEPGDGPEDGEPRENEPEEGEPGGEEPGDRVAAARADFRDALVGVRDYGCEPGEEGSYSTRFVEAYTGDGLYTHDLHLHEARDCSDRPLSFASQLSIESWSLIDPLVTGDGCEAFGIDFETRQERLEGGEVTGYALGTVVYDIAALEAGGVTLGTDLPASPEERGDTLFDPSPAVPWAGLSAPASREGLQGTFAAACFRAKEQTRAFEGATFTETVVYFVDDACTMAHARRVTRWDIEYGEPTRTVFGDAALETRMVAAESAVTEVATDAAGVPEPPAPTEIGKTFFDLWAVVGDELVVGTCLDKGPGDCGTTAALRADVLNLNVGNRYRRR